MINVGRLRDRVRIMRAGTGQDSFGAPVKGYTQVYSLWADVAMLSGRQLIASASQKFESTMRVYVRYNADITAADVVAWKPLRAKAERQLTIDAVIHNETAQRTELLCTEGVQDYHEVNVTNPGNPTKPKPATGKDWGLVTDIPDGVAVGDWGTIKATSEYWVLGDSGMFYQFGNAATDYINIASGAVITPPFPAKEVRGVDASGVRLPSSTKEAAIPAGARLTLINGVIATKQADGRYLDASGKAVVYPSGEDVPVVVLPQTKPTQGKDWGKLTSIPFNDRNVGDLDWKRDTRAIKVYDWGTAANGDYWQLGEFGEFLRYRDGQQTKVTIDPITGNETKYPRPNAGGFDVKGVQAVDELGFRVADGFDPDSLPIGARGTAVNGVHWVKVTADEYVYAAKPAEGVEAISGDASGLPAGAAIPNLPPVVPRNEDGTDPAPHPATGKNWGKITAIPAGIVAGDFGLTPANVTWVLSKYGVFYLYQKPETEFIDPITGNAINPPLPVAELRGTDRPGNLLDKTTDKANIPDGAFLTFPNGKFGSYAGGEFKLLDNTVVEYETGEPVPVVAPVLPAHPATGNNLGVITAFPLTAKIDDYGFTADSSKCWVLNDAGMFYDFNVGATHFINPVTGAEMSIPYPANEVRGINPAAVVLPPDIAESNIPLSSRVTMVNGVTAIKNMGGVWNRESDNSVVVFPSGMSKLEADAMPNFPATGKYWGVTNTFPPTGPDGVHINDYGISQNGTVWILGTRGLFVKSIGGHGVPTFLNPITGDEITTNYPRYVNTWSHCLRGVSPTGYLLDPNMEIADYDTDKLPNGSHGVLRDGKEWNKSGNEFFYTVTGLKISSYPILSNW